MRICLLFLLILFPGIILAQKIENIRHNQSGKQIMVSYDLSGDMSETYVVTLFYRVSGGAWTGPLKAVCGAVGSNQRAGSNKEITWNVLEDVAQLSGEISFKVQADLAGGPISSVSNFTDPRDGHVYKVVTIGAQIWMAENLAYLPTVSRSSSGSDTSPFYYVHGYKGSKVSAAKQEVNYATYGVLYNWEAAKTACPSGWHLPSDAEWKILEKHLGMSEADANTTRWRNSGTVGGMLRQSGKTHWSSPNTGATNIIGFTALPSGDRYYDGGFDGLDDYAYFWSSSENGTSYAWSRSLYYYNDGVNRDFNYRRYGFSVRCLQNE